MDYNFSYFFDIYDRQFKITNDTKILNNGANNINLISFFLASPEGNYHTEEIDFETLANENIIIPKEYDFNHLIPPIELYKEIIDEYCAVMDPAKLAPLQNQINALNTQISNLNNEKLNLQNKFQNELNSLPT
ncbi:TPA: sugar transferase, partial [Campylobacter jejuni]|nr:sugar transferase [Campylobacter jejuni]